MTLNSCESIIRLQSFFQEERKKGDQMLNNKEKKVSALGNEAIFEQGYLEMGKLNISLSEEGLLQDLEDLKNYEKMLMESE